MAKVKEFFQSSAFLVPTIIVGSFLAWAATMRLRYTDPFRKVFGNTCIYVPREELVPTLAVFLIGLVAAVLCSRVLLRQNPWLKRVLLGLTITALTFGVGLLVNAFI